MPDVAAADVAPFVQDPSKVIVDTPLSRLDELVDDITGFPSGEGGANGSVWMTAVGLKLPAHRVDWHVVMLFHLVQEMDTHLFLNCHYWTWAKIVAEAKLRGEPVDALCAWYESSGGASIVYGEGGGAVGGLWVIGWLAARKARN